MNTIIEKPKYQKRGDKRISKSIKEKIIITQNSIK